jgi:type II secretory pathway pseudopilin PulG
MASSFLKNKNSYTLLEVTIVLLLLSFAILIVSQIYLNVINTSIIVNDYYQSLENVRLGTEKLWRILKYGWSFNVLNNGQGLRFQKKDCTTTTISFNTSSRILNYQEENLTPEPVFDPDLVKVNGVIFATDTPNVNETYAYFQYAPKVIIIFYDLEIRSKRGVTTSLIFEQAVAPLNSTYTSNLCQR